MNTTERPDHLHVCRDTTPGPHRTESADIEWWLPVIGPTATILAVTLVRHTDPTGTIWQTEPLAQRIGLAGNRSKLWASLERLERFGIIQFHATDVATIRTHLPALTDRQLTRLPGDLAVRYPTNHLAAVPA